MSALTKVIHLTKGAQVLYPFIYRVILRTNYPQVIKILTECIKNLLTTNDSSFINLSLLGILISQLI